MDKFAEFTGKDLPEYLNSDYMKSRQKQLIARTQQKIQEIGQPFEDELRAVGAACGFRTGRILVRPVDDLMAWYLRKHPGA